MSHAPRAHVQDLGGVLPAAKFMQLWALLAGVWSDPFHLFTCIFGTLPVPPIRPLLPPPNLAATPALDNLSRGNLGAIKQLSSLHPASKLRFEVRVQGFAELTGRGRGWLGRGGVHLVGEKEREICTPAFRSEYEAWGQTMQQRPGQLSVGGERGLHPLSRFRCGQGARLLHVRERLGKRLSNAPSSCGAGAWEHFDPSPMNLKPHRRGVL